MRKLQAWHIIIPVILLAVGGIVAVLFWPAGSQETEQGEKAIAALRRGRAGDRLAAARLLGQLRYRPAVPALIMALGDVRPDVQRAAIAALGRVGSRRASKPLAALLASGDWAVRQATAEALGELADPETIPDLIAALKTCYPQVARATAPAVRAPEGEPKPQRKKKNRRAPGTDPPPAPVVSEDQVQARAREAAALAIAQALVTIGAPAVEPLLACLQDPIGGVRQTAALALGEIGDRRALEVLRDLLQDDDPMTRLAGAGALVALGDVASARKVVTLMNHGDPDVQAELARLLVRMGPDALEGLAPYVKDPDWRVRLLAVDTLAQIVHPRALELLLAAASDSHRDVKRIATSYVRQRHSAKGTGRSREALLAALKSTDGTVRLNAMILLEAEEGPNITSALIDRLTDDLPHVREAAARLLGRREAKGAAEPLARLLTDTTLAVRVAAAEALNRMGDRRADAVLLDVLRAYADAGSADKPDRKHVLSAIEALGRSRDRRAVPCLIALLKEQVTETPRRKKPAISATPLAIAAVEALGQIGDARAVAPLVEMLDTPDRRAYRLVIEALGLIGDPRATPALVKRLSGSLKENRDAHGLTAQALGRIGDPSAFDPLVALLERTESHRWWIPVIEPCAEALADLAPARAAIPLAAAVRRCEPADHEPRKVFCRLLGTLRDPRGVEPLVELLTFDLPETRVIVIDAIKEIGARGIGELIRAMGKPNAAIRDRIGIVLSEMGPAAVAPVTDALKHKDPHIRQGAAWALGRMRAKESVTALLTALGDGDLEVRTAAAWALGELKAAEAGEPLRELLTDREAKPRAGAARALGKLGGPAAVDLLLDALKDPEPIVRAEAAAGLGTLADPRAAEALRAAAEDKDAEVRRAARYALRRLPAQPRP